MVFDCDVRPYVTVNCAMSADGKIGFVTRKQAKISDEEDLKRVHILRASSDAIIVGIGTILADDPKLTVKEKYVRVKNPIRIILDSNGRTPENSYVLDGKVKTIIVTNSNCKKTFRNAETIRCGEDKIDLVRLLNILNEKGIKKVLVEGGEEVIWSFINDGQVDDLKVFIGSIVLGGKGGPTLAGGTGVNKIEDALPLKLKKVTRLGSGVLLEYSIISSKKR